MALRQVYPGSESENLSIGKLDIIAVHGLNPRSKDEEAHGWNTWRDGRDGSVWLRDELPKYLPDARIFIYIYESTAVYGSSQSTFMDKANKFLECIRVERSEDPDPGRPLIFIGHSLGGLLIEQALINAHNNPDYASIKQATTGLAFFGTPHDGGNNLLVALGGKAAKIAHGLGFQKGDQILQVLENGSIFLDVHREHLRHQLFDYQIRSFWGSRDAVVPRESARFGLPGNKERIISLNADHSGVCKFGKSQIDQDNWKIVRSNIKDLYDLALKEHDRRKHLASQLSRALAARPAPINTIPYLRDPKFVGRSDCLDDLKNGFALGRRMALAGWPGIGKSQIAIEYCYRQQQNQPDLSLLWIRGGSKQNFLESYAEHAIRLSLPGCDNPDVYKMNLVLHWMLDEKNGPWIMILDNVDDETVFRSQAPDGHKSQDHFAPSSKMLVEYLPECQHGSILITSRHQLAALDLVIDPEKIIQINSMTEEEAMLLLRKKVPRDKSPEKDMRRLVQTLEMVPLALSQASAYILRNSTVNISRYLYMFNENQDKLLLDMEAPDIGRQVDGKLSHSVIGTWSISFNHIRGANPDAAELLSLMSLLHHNRIPLKQLTSPDVSDKLEYVSAVSLLTQFSLITMEDNVEGPQESGSDSFTDYFGIHQLVQLLTRKWLERNGELQQWRQNALACVAKVFPYSNNDHKMWAHCEALLIHANKVLEYEVSLESPLLDRAEILYCVGTYYSNKGHYVQARKCLSEASEIRFRFLGPVEKTLRTTRELISALVKVGEFKLAVEHGRRILEQSIESCGSLAPLTISIRVLLGSCLCSDGVYDEAEDILREARRLQQLNDPNDDTLSLVARGNLALLLDLRGRYKEAETEYRELLQLQKTTFGDDDPETLNTESNMLVLLTHLEKLTEARDMGYETWGRRSELYGETHPLTVLTQLNLALVLLRLGDTSLATTYAEDALLQMEQKLPYDHPYTLAARQNLSVMLVEAEMYNEGAKLSEEVMLTKKRVLGSHHRDTLFSMLQCGVTQSIIGNNSSAVKILQDALYGYQYVYSPDHPEALMVESTLASILAEEGKYAEAESHAHSSLVGLEMTLGRYHTNTFHAKRRLSYILDSTGSSASAELLLKATLADMEEAGVKKDRNYFSIVIALTSILSDDLTRWTEADKLYTKVISEMKDSDISMRLEVLVSSCRYARMLSQVGKLREAEEICREGLQECESLTGKQSWYTYSTLDVLAEVLLRAGKISLAEETCHESLLGWRKTYGDQHHMALRAMAKLGDIYSAQGREDETLQLRRDIVDLREKVWGRTNLETLAARTRLGTELGEQSKNEEAKRVFEEVLGKRRAILGDDHAHVLDTIFELADLSRKRQEFKEAEELFSDVLAKRVVKFGDKAETTLATRNNLALALRGQKKFAEAEQMDRNLLKDRQIIFGEDHIKTSLSYNNLAMTLHDQLDVQEKIEEAEKLMRKAVAIRSDVLGSDHPDTLFSKFNLADILQTQKMWRESEEILRSVFNCRLLAPRPDAAVTWTTFHKLHDVLKEQGNTKGIAQVAREVLSAFRTQCGPESMATLGAMVLLGRKLLFDNNFQESEPLIHQAIDGFEKTSWLDTPDALDALQLLAISHRMQGRYADAVPAAKTAVEARARVRGVDHEDTQASMSVLAICLNKSGQAAQAEVVAKDLILIRERVLGPEADLTLNSKHILLESLYEQRRLEDARQVADKLLVSFQLTKGVDALQTWSYMESVISFEAEVSAWSTAATWTRQLLIQKENKFGLGHQDTVITKHYLANCEFFSGNYAKAVLIYHSLFEHHRDVTPNEAEMLNIQTSLAVALRWQGRYTEAERVCREAIEGTQKLLGVTHLQTFKSLSCLIEVLTDVGRYSEAEELASAGYRFMIETLGEDHDQSIRCKQSLGVLASRLGNKAYAVETLKDALRGRIKIQGKNGRQTLGAAFELGKILAELDRVWEAEMYLRRVALGGESSYGASHPRTGEFWRSYVLFLLEVWKENRVNTRKEELRSALSTVGFWPRLLPLLKAPDLGHMFRSTSPLTISDSARKNGECRVVSMGPEESDDSGEFDVE